LDEFHHAEMVIRSKTDAGTVTKPETDHQHSLEVRAHDGTEKGGTAARCEAVTISGCPRVNSKSVASPGEQCQCDMDENLHNAKTTKGGLSATAQSFVSRRRQESLSDVSNSSAMEYHKEQSQHDKDLNKVDEELEDNEDKPPLAKLEQDGHGHVDENGKPKLRHGENLQAE
jgi:uncharacterized protein (DUF885 family)